MMFLPPRLAARPSGGAAIRTSLGGVVILLLVAPAIAGCLQFRDRAGELRLTIGGIVSDGGAAGDLYSPFQAAAARANGAHAGLKIQTILESATGGDAGAAYDRLVQRGAAAVVDLRGPAEVAALASRASATPLLLPASQDVVSAGPAAYWLAPPASGEAAAMSRLAEQAGAKKVVIARVDDPYGAALERALLGHWPNATTVVLRGSFGSAICAGGPDTVLLAAGRHDALRALQTIAAAGCRERVRVVASTEAFGMEPNDPGDVQALQGVVGVAPATAKYGVLRAIMRTTDPAVPQAFAGEAFDAVDYVVLASLAAWGGKERDRERHQHDFVAITPRDVQSNLLRVSSSPGVKHTDLAIAAEAIRTSDDIDWVGFAHDIDLDSGTRAAGTGRYVAWTTLSDGSSQLAPDRVLG